MLAITQGRRPPRPTHPNFAENLWTLMQRCWDQDPHLRPEVSEALQVLLTPSVLCLFQYLYIHQFFYPSTSSELPAWKQLISRTSTTDERISLITTIFVDRDQVEMVMRLSGDDAQTVVDVIDEVRPCIILPSRSGWVDSRPNFHTLSARCWIALKIRSAKSVCVQYTGSAATKPWFRNHL